MKRFLLTFAALVAVVAAGAAPRSARQAQELAERFVAANSNLAKHRGAALELSTSVMAEARDRGTAEAPAYYVYNIDGDEGFVVVAGDDRFKEILGYSVSGSVAAADDMPDGLRYWLGFLAREMEAARAYYDANGIEAVARTRAAEQRMHADIAPLLSSRWDQTAPYNDLCPMTTDGRAVTGCVATGMAQIMNYHKYPQRGIGSHENGWWTGQSFNFGETVYDWDSMADTYGTESTEAQRLAVATLMAHCGCAVDMRYSASVSGTPNIYAGIALVNYFGYNPNLHYEGRDQMSAGEWKALLLQELEAKRPVAYSGMTGADSGEGHFFVCDGYEAASGKFHFNWGWSGRYDGYYEISALEPGTGGTGAGTGSFNYYQGILVGVQPETMGEYETHFEMSTLTPKSMSVNQGSNMEFVTTNLANNTINFSGKIGLAVYKDGALFETFMEAVPTGLVSGAHMSEPYSVFCKFPGKYTAGTYRICLVAQRDGSDKLEVIRADYGTPTYWDAEVTGEPDYKVKFTAVAADVRLSDCGVAPVVVNNGGKAYANAVAEFEVTVRNEGSAEFYDEAGVQILRGRKVMANFAQPLRLAQGEQKTITVGGLIDFAEGEYTVVPCYGDNGSFVALDADADLTVEPDSANCIGGVGTDKAVAAVEYFNLAGVRIGAPQGGVAIRKVTFEDGSVAVDKIIDRRQ